ncbi:Dual specificity protein phosphatase 1, partial [Diplonema papillatum]
TVYLVENPNVSLPTPAKCARWKKVSITVDNSPELVEQAELLASETQGRVTVQWNQIFPSKVLPGVYLGSVRSAQDPRIYKHLNITNLASIGRELSVVLAKGMRHMQSNVDDLSNTDITTEFDTVHSFIDEARKAEEGVLVHCFKGQSRSATLVITYLMRTFSLTLDEAFKFV